jgi:hypothetical protein
MNTKRMAALLLAQVTLGFILSAVVFAQPSLAPTAAEIDQGVSAALRDLYAHNMRQEPLAQRPRQSWSSRI